MMKFDTEIFGIIVENSEVNELLHEQRTVGHVEMRKEKPRYGVHLRQRGQKPIIAEHVYYSEHVYNPTLSVLKNEGVCPMHLMFPQNNGEMSSYSVYFDEPKEHKGFIHRIRSGFRVIKRKFTPEVKANAVFYVKTPRVKLLDKAKFKKKSLMAIIFPIK